MATASLCGPRTFGAPQPAWCTIGSASLHSSKEKGQLYPHDAVYGGPNDLAPARELAEGVARGHAPLEQGAGGDRRRVLPELHPPRNKETRSS
jgi:hypothetical protein